MSTISVDLRVASANRIEVTDIQVRSDLAWTAPSAISSVTAIIESTKGGGAIANSSITLTTVSGVARAYQGTFPATVSLTAGTTYYVKVSVTADSLAFVEYESTEAHD